MLYKNDLSSPTLAVKKPTGGDLVIGEKHYRYRFFNLGPTLYLSPGGMLADHPRLQRRQPADTDIHHMMRRTG
jgi:hypothetical protein